MPKDALWNVLLLSGIIGGNIITSTMAAPASLPGNVSSTHDKRLLGIHEHDVTHALCKMGIRKNLDAYSPYRSQCPGDDFQWIRPADSLSQSEKDYLEKRRPKLEASWAQRMEAVGLEAPPRLPVVAMALSGGGYRAMISGSGMAFQQNTTAGSVGDILSLSSYISGLSGGSWAIATHYANNGRAPDDLAKNVCDIPYISSE